jgi:Tol biopolymer transport system component
MPNARTKDRNYGIVAISARVVLTVAAGLVFVVAASHKWGGDRSRTIRWTDETPAWSPNGREIVFASNRARPSSYTDQLYLIRLDGSGLRRLTFGEDAREPSFSPDGTRILYDQNVLQPDNHYSEQSQIAVMTVNGRNVRLLSGDLTGDLEQPTWSPDGRRVAFFDTVWDGNNGDYIASLYVVNADGSDLRKLATNIDGWSFSWSQDSTRIAVSGVDEGLYLLRADRRRPLDVRVDNAYWTTTDIAWSPDGTQIAYVRGKNTWDGSGDLTPRYLWTRNLDTGRTRRLREVADSDSVVGFAQTIDWIPGRTPRLAVYDCTGTYLLAADGRVLRTLPGDALAPGSASPDGRHLVQIENPGGYRSALVLSSTTGGGSRRITQETR